MDENQKGSGGKVPPRLGENSVSLIFLGSIALGGGLPPPKERALANDWFKRVARSPRGGAN